MSKETKFIGFQKGCVDFFMKLSDNNNREWFKGHKSDFDNHVMAPSREFVIAMGERLKEITPEITADPRVNRSIFRIYRDIRFSKDKTPYKTHLSIWMWEGDCPKFECSGFYFRLSPPNIMLGAGIHIFSTPLLKAFRDSVVHPIHGPSLAAALSDVGRVEAFNIGGKHYKRTPRGYDPQNAYAELLLYNGLTVGWERLIPSEFYSTKLIDFCFEKFRDMLPIHKWLIELTERVNGDN